MRRVPSRSPTSIVDPWTVQSEDWAASGPAIGTTVISMERRLHAASTSPKLVTNGYLTQNEIDAASQVHFDELNVQNQPKITWPANFIVARAYIDQLNRSSALAPERIALLNA